jgi:hypothetical protein
VVVAVTNECHLALSSCNTQLSRIGVNRRLGLAMVHRLTNTTDRSYSLARSREPTTCIRPVYGAVVNDRSETRWQDIVSVSRVAKILRKTARLPKGVNLIRSGRDNANYLTLD